MARANRFFSLDDWSVSVSDESLGERIEPCLWSDGDLIAVASLSSGEKDYAVRFGDMLTANISMAGRRISLAAREGIPETTIEHLLADQIVPRVLAQLGHLVLHGGLLSRDGAGIALMGETGRGKSTLSAYLATQGWKLLGDDAMIVATDAAGGPAARAVYPSLRLLPDSLAGIYGEAPETRPMAHYSAKRHVDLGDQPDSPPAPLSALFFLAAPPADGGVAFHRLSEAQACMAIMANSFALDPTNLPLARGKFADASALARTVPAYELVFPRDYARLPEVAGAIVAQLFGATGSAASPKPEEDRP